MSMSSQGSEPLTLGLKTTYTLGLLPVWWIKSIGSTKTQMFSPSQILTTGPFTHSSAACYSLQLLIAGPLILTFPMWNSDL